MKKYPNGDITTSKGREWILYRDWKYTDKFTKKLTNYLEARFINYNFKIKLFEDRVLYMDGIGPGIRIIDMIEGYLQGYTDNRML